MTQLPTHATAEAIEATLRQLLEPTELMVRDDSADHAGHAGAREGSHISVRIRSPRFLGLTRVARHRLVYDALRPMMHQGIHALALETLDPV